MRVPILQRAFFWDGKADTGTTGYALLLHCYFKYMTRESICVCVCVHIPPSLADKTNAQCAPESVVDVAKGGPGWNSMVYYAWHLSQFE